MIEAHPTEPAPPAIEHGVLGWETYTSPTGLPMHVVPYNDIDTHMICRSGECRCRPRFDDEHNMFTHNSYDRREEYVIEHGKRKLS